MSSRRGPSSVPGRAALAALVAAAIATAGCTVGSHGAGVAPSGGSAATSVAASPSALTSTPSSPDDGTVSASGQIDVPTPEQLKAIDPARLTRFYSQKIKWTACSGTLQCGSLIVPIDYGNPTGATISLALIRHRSTDRNRVGSVVLNPGGPGGSGVNFAKQAWSKYSSLFDDRFDVVSFDPRGVGESDPVRCASAALEDSFVSIDTNPESESDVEKLARLNAQFANGCKQKSGALLPHVGTVDTARDLDVLRAALGDAKLTYVGESYGTFLGQLYAQLFPHKVRALVLDGVVDPAATDVTEGIGQAAGFETALRAFVGYCVRQNPCAAGTSSSDAEGKLDNWLDGLATKPLTGSGGRRLTRALALDGVAAGLYSPQSWPYLNAALRAAMHDSPSMLLSLADLLIGRDADGSYSNELEANVAINCADRGSVSTSIRDAAQAAIKGESAGPTFGQFLGWGNSVCIDWPVPVELAPGPIRAPGAPPILLVATTRDPATPMAWAKAVAANLESGVLVTWDGDGHTAVLRSPCVDHIVSAYVVSLTVPASGTACAASS